MSFEFKNIAPKGSDFNQGDLHENHEEISRKKMLRVMNAIKIVSPIIQALLIESGLDKSDKAMTENFLDFVKASSDLSHKTCLKLNINPNLETNFWIRNVLEKLFSQFLKEQWIAHLKIDINQIEELIDIIVEQDLHYENPEFHKIEVNQISDLQTTLMRATINVLSKIKSTFDLKRDTKKDIEVIMTKILETSKKQLVELVDDNFTEEDKTNLLKLLILEAGELYSCSWSSYANFANNFYNNLKDTDKAKFDKKYPNGLPITQLENDFDDYFDKITIVAKKLLPQNNGPINKRINKK